MRKFLLKILVLFIALAVFQNADAQRNVSGTVTDESESPLEGATVFVKGAKAATTTNASGKYTITVPEGSDMLVFSFVGKQSQELVIGNRTQIDVSLVSLDNMMTDVVVVGYGEAKKSNLTTAQVGVSAKQINETVNTTIEQAIQGRAAGVYITQNTGQPGGGMSVNIRGISSLNGTQPLYVIDGVQIQNSDVNTDNPNATTSNPLAGLNPADIEDIQILQGPSATAIYGSRGTNGVVLITTKRGKAGEADINYIYQYNIQTPPKSLDVMDLPQYAQMVAEYHAQAGGNTPKEFLDPTLLGKGTDWQKVLFNNAAMQKHQLNFSGGSESLRYYLSGEYLKQEGVAEGSGFDRMGVRLNLDNDIRKWGKLSVNLSYSQTKENLVATNYNDAAAPLISNALRLTPQIPVENYDGSWGGSDPVNGANQYAPINPIALANLITNNNKKKEFLGGVNLSIKLLPGLTLRSSLNGSIGSGFGTYYTPTYNLDQWHVNLTAKLSNSTFQSWYWNWNELLDYTKSFGKHNLNVMVSHEAQESLWKAFSGSRTGFLTNDVFDLNAGDPQSAENGGGTYPWAMESYLGRITYNYDNRYILVGTYRRDGSPNFGQDKRWGGFPSASVAWRVNNERFFNVPFISDLKLRFEKGLTGNQGSGSGVYAAMNTGATPWGTGFIPATFTNAELQWEETNTDNIGLNLGLFDNRITFDGNYYVKKTDNLLMEASLPWYMGTNASPGAVGAPLVNTGSLKTKGWAFTINTVNIDKGDFKWESNFNLSHFDTKIVSLNSDNAFIERVSWWMNNWTQRAAIGKAPWLFRGYIADGVFQTTDDIAKSAVPADNNGDRLPIDEGQGIWIGDVKYKDISGPDGKPDGIIDVNDMTNIGNPWPKLTAGFTNTFTYKNLSLNILIIGVSGNDVYNYIKAEASNPNNINLSRNLFTEAFNYSKPSEDGSGNPILENPGSSVPRMTTNSRASDNNYAVNSTRFVEDGSYLRIKNISLTYSLNKNLLDRTRVIRDVKLTAGVQNIYTLTRYSGYDPEIGAYVGTGSEGGNQAIGIDFGRYPLTPIYTFTISANF